MTHTRIQNFTEALEAATSCYQRFHLLLAKEREQFLGFDAEGLVHTTAEKRALLGQLRQAEEPLLEHKEELARLWNLPGEEIGLEELIDQAPLNSAGRVQELGGALIRWAQKVSDQLQRNRAMLEEGLAFVQDAMACFQGAMTGESTGYAPVRNDQQRKPRAVCLRREV